MRSGRRLPFSVAAGTPRFDTGTAIVLGPEQCRVVELDTGATTAVSAAITATISIENGSPSPLTPFDVLLDVDA